MANRQSIILNLGIDFGTSFTKVCVRDVGAEDSALVTFGANGIEGAVIPSIVYFDDNGVLSLSSKPEFGCVRYLKMRLADMPIPDNLDDDTKGIIDIENPDVINALSSWYLASTLKMAQAWVVQHWEERIKFREPMWTANSGVPVEHADSPIIEKFEMVNSVAWEWAMNNDLPIDLDSAISSYNAIENNEKNMKKFNTTPEISAAVQSFVTSRDAIESIYIYVDVGGGTLDAVCFHYFRREGEREINVYSGKVIEVGAAVLAKQLGGNNFRLFEKDLIENRLTPSQIKALTEWKKPIHDLIGKVISKGKEIDGRNWRQIDIQVQPSQDWLLRLRERDDDEVKSLGFFVGGGGANSEWFQETIIETYTVRKLNMSNIPPFDLMRVPLPKDLDIGVLNDRDFLRYSIAYGLSVPEREAPEVRLPNKFKRKEQKEQDASQMPEDDYLHSKDAHD